MHLFDFMNHSKEFLQIKTNKKLSKKYILKIYNDN